MMRFRIEARDVPLEVAARRLGMPPDDFKKALPKLFARGFPRPDPDTGNFDLRAIDQWCDARHSHLFGAPGALTARDARSVAEERIAAIGGKRG